jgi:hypothetical protein
MLTVENGTLKVTEELLEKVGLLTGDFVEAIALATLLDVAAGKTSAQLGVEVWVAVLAKGFFSGRAISPAAERVVWWSRRA